LNSQEVDALVSHLRQQMEETRAAKSKISIERDEAVARNACLTQMVNKSRKQRAGVGGGRRDLIDSSSPGSMGSPSVYQFVNVATGEVETIETPASERDASRNEARANEERRASAQDTLDNVLVCNDETNARYQEEIRRRDAQNEELDVQNEKLRQR